MRLRLPIIGAAALYLVGLLLVGLWPTHVDRNLDMVNRPPTTWLIDIFDLDPAQGYRIGEFSANILLFIPLGALALALLPRLGWLRVTALAGLFSVVIEVTQTIARPERTGSVADIVANTAGAAIGAIVVVLVLGRVGQHRR
ncbi:VanZ family protein [Aeromicrobium stalagmiti]|uniref:VanZ family protein n=1 Tax=Aeromicrobium stalagmiti TaxID=2738988 RepID=UPI001567FBD9|nr:VanZ family protein [Aeromicrobium stalagmiti]NRQ49123.1 VanZ family protein [Aeromicrobium stalagmiti]